jgi:hypothetical protein
MPYRLKFEKEARKTLSQYNFLPYPLPTGPVTNHTTQNVKISQPRINAELFRRIISYTRSTNYYRTKSKKKAA